MLSTRDPPQNKRPIQAEIEGLEKIFQANGQEKKSQVAILRLEKVYFKTKDIKRDREGQFIILKEDSIKKT